MTTNYINTQKWRVKAKLWAIKYAGNHCQHCGYDKYVGNLAFHHIGEKTDTIARLINSTSSWDVILKEINNCVLVCHNCHGEIHAGIIDSPSINYEERSIALKEILKEQPQHKTKQFHNCTCGKIINKNHKFCSLSCSNHDQQRIIWPDNLPELVKLSSKLAVSRKLGVSDKAVAKRLKNHH